MGDHFVLLMDRLLTESTLAEALESRNRSMEEETPSSPSIVDDDSSHKVDILDLSTSGKVVECRICQDEDFDSNMETPCSCCGSLKAFYAHRKCVQRWCNEKGNTTCEICHQPFKPGYTAPPPLFQLRQVPVNFRGNWHISRAELNNARLITMVSTTDQHFPDPMEDEYSASSTRNVIYLRLVLVIFTVLLILRHTLPIILSGTYEYSLPLFMLLFLRTAGVILPIFVILKAITSMQRRPQQLVVQNIEVDTDEDIEDIEPES
ncbi:hypothetical protein ACFE04_030180 [Oxalis oulophora]